jgi:hypothetical protein
MNEKAVAHWRKTQRLNYIHSNPVEAGIMLTRRNYLYSSAINYAGLPEKIIGSDIDMINVSYSSLETEIIVGTSLADTCSLSWKTCASHVSFVVGWRRQNAPQLNDHTRE